MAATFSDLWILKPKVFISDLGPNANEDELKELFTEYGPVQDLWLAKDGNGFALVEFQVDKDGLRATHGLKKTIIEVKSTTSTIGGASTKRSKNGTLRRGGSTNRGSSPSVRPSRPRHPSTSRDLPTSKLPDTISAFEAVRRMEQRCLSGAPSHRDHRNLRGRSQDQVSTPRERKPASPIPTSAPTRRQERTPIYERRRSHPSDDRRYIRSDLGPSSSPKFSYRIPSPPPVKRRYVTDIPPERPYQIWTRRSETRSSPGSSSHDRRNSFNYYEEPNQSRRKPASPSPYQDPW